jgi:flagellar motility protein MotE (MotC chaperone)
MLPGGLMPIVQLIEIARSVSPKDAANLLRELPEDRLLAVVAGIGPKGAGRLLSGASGDFRAKLFSLLSESQLLDVLRVQSESEATRLLTSLPDERLHAVIATMRDDKVIALLPALSETRQASVLEAMDPRRRLAVLTRKYEREVADALVRANVEVSVPPEEGPGIMLAQGLGWRIVVAAGYDDDGTASVPAAEAGAYRLGANAALSVTTHKPSDAVAGYCRDAQAQGRPLEAVSWTGERHDSQLKRTLVSLFH